MKYYIMLLCFSVLLFSCEDNEVLDEIYNGSVIPDPNTGGGTGPVEPEGDPLMTFTVNGDVTVTTSEVTAEKVTQSPNYTVIIDADFDDGSGVNIVITKIGNPVTTGNYPFNPTANPNTICLMTYSDADSNTFSSTHSNPTGFSPGSITISNINATFVSGAFSTATLKDNATGDTVEITNATFSNVLFE